MGGTVRSLRSPRRQAFRRSLRPSAPHRAPVAPLPQLHLSDQPVSRSVQRFRLSETVRLIIFHVENNGNMAKSSLRIEPLSQSSEGTVYEGYRSERPLLDNGQSRTRFQDRRPESMVFAMY